MLKQLHGCFNYFSCFNKNLLLTNYLTILFPKELQDKLFKCIKCYNKKLLLTDYLAI